SPAAPEAGQAPQPPLHGADRHLPAAVLDPGEHAAADRPRLGLLPREPAARALPPGGRAAPHRFRRAQEPPPRRRPPERRGRPARLISFARRMSTEETPTPEPAAAPAAPADVHQRRRLLALLRAALAAVIL